jgi:hypothetical protein
MKLIHKKELLLLDHEIVFSYHNDTYLGPHDLCILTQTLPRDFVYQPLINTIECNGSDEYADLHAIAEQDSNFDLIQDYNCCSRDGLFEDDSKYYVLSKNDLGKLIDRLSITFNQMPDEIISEPFE